MNLQEIIEDMTFEDCLPESVGSVERAFARIATLEAELAASVPRDKVEALITEYTKRSSSRATDSQYRVGVATGFGIVANNLTALLTPAPAEPAQDAPEQFSRGYRTPVGDEYFSPSCTSCATLRAALVIVSKAPTRMESHDDYDLFAVTHGLQKIVKDALAATPQAKEQEPREDNHVVEIEQTIEGIFHVRMCGVGCMFSRPNCKFRLDEHMSGPYPPGPDCPGPGTYALVPIKESAPDDS